MQSRSHTPSSSVRTGATTVAVSPRLGRAIEAVRKQLPVATNFARLHELFVERVGRAPELWAQSQRREHQLLFSYAVTIARQLRPGFEPHTSMLYDIGDTGFSHGAVLGNDGLACIFHDQSVGMGLVAVLDPFDLCGEIGYVRFRPTMFGHVHGASVEPGGP